MKNKFVGIFSENTEPEEPGNVDLGPSVTFIDPLPVFNFSDQNNVPEANIREYIDKNIEDGKIIIINKENNETNQYIVGGITIVENENTYLVELEIIVDGQSFKKILTGFNTSIFNLKVIQVAAGDNFNVFLLEDGTAMSVGSNFYGQLGDGTNTDRIFPVKVLAGEAKSKGNLFYYTENEKDYLQGISSIASYGRHVVFLLNDGTVVSTGYNKYGQLGNGNNLNSNFPVIVKGGESGTESLNNIVKVSAGEYNSSFLTMDSKILSVGYNFYNQLGNGKEGTLNDSNTPVYVLSGEAKNEHSVICEISGVQKNCLTGVSDMDIGENHQIFLMNDSTVMAVGRGSYGQLGNEKLDSFPLPVRVLSGEFDSSHFEMCNIDSIEKKCLKDVISVSAGKSHSLVLLSDGFAGSFGLNDYGQLGISSVSNKSKPFRILSGEAKETDSENGYIKNVKQISAGEKHSVFIIGDSENNYVLSVGLNSSGQLTRGISTNYSTLVRSVESEAKTLHSEYCLIEPVNSCLRGVSRVVTGKTHNIFIMNDSSLMSSGSNNKGQLANGSATSEGIGISKAIKTLFQ